MRVLVVDDEAPARARLRQLLVAHADVEIAGEAETGTQAMQAVAELRPDVVLLDIQMPGCSGIDVASCLPEPRPHVIFCTAYDQHAVDAFELHAVDYLLKPISRARLAQALERVRTAPAARPATDAAIRAQRTGPMRLVVKQGAHYVVLPESEILYFGSEDGLTRVTAGRGQFWMDPALNELEERLSGGRFFRVSRAALVNLDAVREVIPMPGGSGEVSLVNGERLEVSRRRFRELMEALERGAHA
jgi:two-component system LytT family response regulator